MPSLSPVNRWLILNCDVDHRLDARVRIVHGLEAARNKRGERLAVIRERQLAERPDHAVRDLIADLHHLRQRARRLEVAEHLLRIVVDIPLHLLGVVLFPGLRRPLLAGIRPEIAVVEIDEHLQPERVRALRHRERPLRRRIAAAVLVGGGVPDTQADPVDAVLLHDGALVLQADRAVFLRSLCDDLRHLVAVHELVALERAVA